jgi:hypothetical protein
MPLRLFAVEDVPRWHLLFPLPAEKEVFRWRFYVHLVKMTHQGASKIRELSLTYESVRNFGESSGRKAS